MPLMVWDENMSIGVEEIDKQHKRLFLLANGVADRIRTGLDKEAIQKDLRALCDYAVEHFAAEEALMDMDNYPEYDLHLNEHMQCTTKAMDFLEIFAEDRDVDMNEFLQFLTFWIRDHILNMDMTLAKFLRAQEQVRT